MPIALVVITIRNLTLGSISRFVRSIGGNYSGAHQSVGPATILRRPGPIVIFFERPVDPRKQTRVDLKNLKKITRNTPANSKKIISSP